MLTHTLAHRGRTFHLTAFAAAALLATSFGTPAAFAKGGPTVTVDGEVNIAGPVEIHGVVETLNDPLREPFAQQRSITLQGDREQLDFDLPVGKRLIIETISFGAAAPAGQKVRVIMDVSPSPICFLPSQQLIDEDSLTIHLGTHAVRIRVDGTDESDHEIRVRVVRSSDTGTANFSVSIFGYLVDI